MTARPTSPDTSMSSSSALTAESSVSGLVAGASVEERVAAPVRACAIDSRTAFAPRVAAAVALVEGRLAL